MKIHEYRDFDEVLRLMKELSTDGKGKGKGRGCAMSFIMNSGIEGKEYTWGLGDGSHQGYVEDTLYHLTDIY